MKLFILYMIQCCKLLYLHHHFALTAIKYKWRQSIWKCYKTRWLLNKLVWYTKWCCDIIWKFYPVLQYHTHWTYYCHFTIKIPSKYLLISHIYANYLRLITFCLNIASLLQFISSHVAFINRSINTSHYHHTTIIIIINWTTNTVQCKFHRLFAFLSANTYKIYTFVHGCQNKIAVQTFWNKYLFEY
jgi:hypothetical protein